VTDPLETPPGEPGAGRRPCEQAAVVQPRAIPGGRPPPPLPEDLLARMTALCQAEPEREVCGFVGRRGDALEVVAVPNAVDRYHAADPVRFPLTRREGYLMDPRTLVRLYRALDASGGEIVVVWHSHPHGPACFSPRDRADALIEGVPQVPGADYLVLGMEGGRVVEARRYRLEGGAFVEVERA
jgi:proteasome lid subunit RPN8/RPN11